MFPFVTVDIAETSTTPDWIDAVVQSDKPIGRRVIHDHSPLYGS